MIHRVGAIAVLGLLAVLAGGCNPEVTNGGNGGAVPSDGAQRFRVAVRTEGVPAEKVDALVEAAAALLRRRLSIEGYASYRVEKGEGSQLAVAIGGDARPEDLRLLIEKSSSLAFRLEAGVEEYRDAVYPRKAPEGFRWFTKPVDPHDVVAGAGYRILAQEAPAVDASGAVLAETVPGAKGTEVLISLTPAAIAALQAALLRASPNSRVAITVNDVLVAAPQFGSRIDGSDVTLSGGYENDKAQAIAAGLNAAIVPRHLEFLTEQTLGPPLPDTADARR